jgi:hypothetical protein
MEIIHKHLELIDPMRRFNDLAELSTWYQQQKDRLASVSDDRLKRSLLARLHDRYSELSTRLLEEMHT